jgi:hypothetical protein
VADPATSLSVVLPMDGYSSEEMIGKSGWRMTPDGAPR